MAKSRRTVPARAIRRPWPRWLGLVAVGTLALGLRLANLAELRDSPLFAVLVGDGQRLDPLGPPHYRPRLQVLGAGACPTPLYSLAIVYSIAGHSLMAVRVLQAMGGTAACVLLALAGRRSCGGPRRPGRGLLLAVSARRSSGQAPPIQKSSLDLLLATLLLAVLGEFLQQGRAGRGSSAPAPRWAPLRSIERTLESSIRSSWDGSRWASGIPSPPKLGPVEPPLSRWPPPSSCPWASVIALGRGFVNLDVATQQSLHRQPRRRPEAPTSLSWRGTAARNSNATTRRGSPRRLPGGGCRPPRCPTTGSGVRSPTSARRQEHGWCWWAASCSP